MALALHRPKKTCNSQPLLISATHVQCLDSAYQQQMSTEAQKVLPLKSVTSALSLFASRCETRCACLNLKGKHDRQRAKQGSSRGMHFTLNIINSTSSDLSQSAECCSLALQFFFQASRSAFSLLLGSLQATTDMLQLLPAYTA